MAYQALLTGYLGLEPRGSNDFAIMTKGDSSLLFDLIQECPETLLIYDHVYIDANLLEGLYERNPDSPFLAIPIFRDLVDMGIIAPLDLGIYVDLSDEGVTYFQNLCNSILDSFPKGSHLFDDWWLINGMILEMHAAAARRIRPFTWNPVISKWQSHIGRILNSKESLRQVVSSYVEKETAQLRYELTRSQGSEEKEELTNEINALDVFWIANQQLLDEKRSSRRVKKTPTVVEVFRSLVPDIKIVEEDIKFEKGITITHHTGRTIRNFDRFLQARERMSSFRKEIHSIADDIDITIRQREDKEDIRRLVAQKIENAHDIILSEMPFIKRLHWLASNPYITAAIGFFLPFSDFALGRATTGIVRNKTKNVPAQTRERLLRRYDLNWYFEYLDISKTFTKDSLVTKVGRSIMDIFS